MCGVVGQGSMEMIGRRGTSERERALRRAPTSKGDVNGAIGAVGQSGESPWVVDITELRRGRGATWQRSTGGGEGFSGGGEQPKVFKRVPLLGEQPPATNLVATSRVTWTNSCLYSLALRWGPPSPRRGWSRRPPNPTATASSRRKSPPAAAATIRRLRRGPPPLAAGGPPRANRMHPPGRGPPESSRILKICMQATWVQR